MSRVGRRQLLIATAALFTAPLAGGAQQAGKVYRIGFLSAAPKPIRPHAALFDGLRAVGYIEGRNLIVERRYAGVSLDRLNEFAADLVRQKPQLEELEFGFSSWKRKVPMTLRPRLKLQFGGALMR